MRTSVFVTIVALSSGCTLFGYPSQKSAQDPAGTPAAAAPAATTAATGSSGAPAQDEDLTQSLFAGTTPSSPAPYKGVRPGMSKDEAARLVPALANDNLVAKDTKAGTRATVRWSEDKTEVDSLFVMFSRTDVTPLAEKAWGAPVQATGRAGGKPIHLWFNPEEKLRAAVEPYGNGSTLRIEPYEPVAAFLGDAGTTEPAFQTAQPLLGATLEQLKTAYPDALEARGTGAHLDFAPTDFGEHFTRVNLRFDKQGKVSEYAFKLDFGMHPPAKESLDALLRTKFGPPKTTEKYGKTSFVHRAKAPRIEVGEDTITHAWEVRVSAK
jgi:hypothetical protein